MPFFCFRKKSKPGVIYKIDQESLLEYLEKGNLRDFENLLKHKDEYNTDLDHVYGRTCNKTCLAEASKRGRTKFMKALLNNGANPNFVCGLHFGRAAIHFAAVEGKVDAIRCLVEHSPTQTNDHHTQINAIDNRGDTALHLIASSLTVKGKHAEECFSYLASRKDADVRHRNAKGLSAISMAVGKCSEYIWEAVLERSDLRPEDRQLILDWYPKLKKDNQVTIETIYTHDDAYTALRDKDLINFKGKFKKDFVNKTDMIETTFLQLACKEGYLDIVEFLLECGADVNQTGTHEHRPPVYLACYHGQYDILKRLFKTNEVQVGFVEEKSLLHGVLQGLGDRTPTDGYRKCFRYLLKKQSQIPINHCDVYGHTALHYAAELEDGYYAKTLLEHGAYIGHLNEFGFSPLHDIGPQVLEEILDNCVDYKKTKEDNQYELTFNFNMLKPTEKCDTTEQTKDAESGKRHQERLPEMSPLYFISRSNKFEHLLKHPVLLMFLHLKWNRIRMLFYINMIYYITFVIFLTANILSETYSSGKCNGNSEPSVVRDILIVLTVMLVVRELIQFCLLPQKWRYLCKLDNILEVSIIATTILMLVGTCCKLLIAVTLLLAWMEVILQLGCIYSLAVYNEMMKRVTLNYIKFLFCYLPLILAFSFSFYVLYHKEHQSERKNGTFYVNNASVNFSVQDDDNKVDFYSYLHFSLLKTAVMMIGEFDASDMRLNNEIYFVFLFFVFMMTIVLMNLLNGLAVSDTQAIKNDAELVACRSKVQLVHHFESVVFGGPLKNRCRCQLTGGSPSLCCPWQRRLQKAISLFPDTLSDGCLVVVLNHGTRYTNLKMDKSDRDKEFRPDTCCRIGKYRMGLEVDRKVLVAAKNIADKRKKQDLSEKNEIVSRIAKVEEDLQGCMNQLANLEGLLKQLINDK
jgi:ankyrin repeat protein